MIYLLITFSMVHWASTAEVRKFAEYVASLDQFLEYDPNYQHGSHIDMVSRTHARLLVDLDISGVELVRTFRKINQLSSYIAGVEFELEVL